MEQFVSKGVLDLVDNFVLQKVIWLVNAARIRNEQIMSIALNKCSHSDKQRIYIEGLEYSEKENELCTFSLSSFYDGTLIAYQFVNEDGNKVQVFCLESEALSLIK